MILQSKLLLFQHEQCYKNNKFHWVLQKLVNGHMADQLKWSKSVVRPLPSTCDHKSLPAMPKKYVASGIIFAPPTMSQYSVFIPGHIILFMLKSATRHSLEVTSNLTSLYSSFRFPSYDVQTSRLFHIF